MTSPEIKILISLAVASIVYAFVCQIRMSRKASKLADWLQKERPDLWSELNFIARNWNGGQPGLKLLYRRNVVDLPSFDQQYEQLHSIERQLLWGITVGAVCIGLVIIDFKFWGWRRWTLKTGQGAKLYVRLLKGGNDYGKNQKKAQSAV